MALTIITTLITSLVDIPPRLQRVIAGYLLSLMVEAPKHTQSFASSITGVAQSQFSRLLAGHKDLALDCLDALARYSAHLAASAREPLTSGAPWTIGIIIDSTLHPRSSLNVSNAQRFNHGDGFVVGHQWSNIVLFIDGKVIPLPPIPFLSKSECRRRGVTYRTEHEHIESYLKGLNLAKYVGSYSDDEVVVLTDAGYDNKRLQRAVLDRAWSFVSALKSSRGARGRWEGCRDSKITWRRVGDLFWAMRGQTPWATVRVKTDGGKRRREFRARKLHGFIKGVSQDLALVCTEKAKGKGKRFFACSDGMLDIGIIVRVFSLRWQVELFHRGAKHQLGLLDAGVEDFASLESHVAWVYCAWLLLHTLEISGESTLLGKQRRLAHLAARAPLVAKLQQVLDAKLQFGGRRRQEELLRAVIQDYMAA